MQHTADTVRASVSYALSTDAAVELLTTAVQAGTAAINLNGSSIQQAIYGNEGVNFLVGNGGNDVLNGFGGNDRLYGGTGIDTLTGGAGSDLFVFNAALNATSNVDVLTDFNVAADTIWLENAVFTALTATDWSGPAATLGGWFSRCRAQESDRQPFLPSFRPVRVKGEHPRVFRFGFVPALFFHVKPGELQRVGRLGFATAGEEDSVDETRKTGRGQD